MDFLFLQWWFKLLLAIALITCIIIYITNRTGRLHTGQKVKCIRKTSQYYGYTGIIRGYYNKMYRVEWFNGGADYEKRWYLKEEV